MSGFQRTRQLMLLVTVLSVVLASCSRPATVKNGGASQVDQRPVPFQDSGEANAATTAPAPFQVQEKISPAKTALPFPDLRSATLPAGTLLTVRLENPISADRNPHGTFSAVVDEPVIVDGNVLVARGTEVMGRVESARSSGLKGNRCCVCLTLDSIGLSGKELPIQTSTLFAHSNDGDRHDSSRNSSPEVIRLKSGHRLTFRLAEATYVASQEAGSR